MKVQIKAILSTLIICVFLNCTNTGKGVNCIVLLDYSASLPNDEFDKYVAMFRQGLLKQMTFEDRIVLIPIDQASEMRNEIIGACNFKQLKDQLAKNVPPLQILKKDAIVRERFAKILDTLFQRPIYDFRDQRKRFNLQTDIIGSLNQATHYLKYPKNALFVFSDMIQDSPEANLTKLNTKSELEKKIDVLMETAQIPDLKNCSVFICGATAVTKKRYRLNKYFWTLFFDRAQARLRDYGYGNANRIADFLLTLRERKS